MIDTTAPEKVYVDGLVDIGIQSLVQAAHDGGDCFISQFECLTGLVNGEQTKVSLFWNDKFICIPQQPLNLYDGSNYNDDILVKVSDLDALAEKYGIPLKEHEPIETDVSVVVTHTQNIETVNHTSELLEIMNRCIAENWENHNPRNPPTNDRLEAWFEENYQGNKLLSGKIKTAMLAIMRPSEYK